MIEYPDGDQAICGLSTNKSPTYVRHLLPVARYATPASATLSNNLLTFRLFLPYLSKLWGILGQIRGPSILMTDNFSKKNFRTFAVK